MVIFSMLASEHDNHRSLPDAHPDESGTNVLTLARRLLDQSIKAVPALRYFLGVVGAAAAATIAGALFFYSWRFAFVGTLTLLGGAIAVVVFANLARFDRHTLRLPALILTWVTIALVIATATCLFTSTFFGKPLDLRTWFVDTAGTSASSNESTTNTAIRGTDVSPAASETEEQVFRAVGLDPDELFLVHTATPLKGSERWRILVTVETRDLKDIRKIREVRYILHPSFNPSEQVTNSVADRFALQIDVWGEFVIHALVYFEGQNKPVRVSRYLNFGLTQPAPQ